MTSQRIARFATPLGQAAAAGAPYRWRVVVPQFESCAPIRAGALTVEQASGWRIRAAKNRMPGLKRRIANKANLPEHMAAFGGKSALL
jgi:hypothetical protein